MLRSSSVALAVMLCSASAPAQHAPYRPAPPATFVISGTVIQGGVQSGANRPLNHVRVTVARNDHPDQQASVTTAEDGRFTFTGVPQGKYTLFAQLRGEQRAFEQDGSYSTGIVTGPLLDSSHILFSFPIPASLSVHVLDEAGDPVSGAQLWLFHKKVEGGWAQIQLLQQSATGIEGSARFSHLEPGIYYLGAGGRPWYAQHIASGNQPPQENAAEFDVAYPITYYDDAQNPNSASPIHISPGDSQKLKIVLRAVPAGRIAIQSAERDANSPPPPTPVLSAIGPGGAPIQIPVSFEFEGGSLSIGGVAPGNYRVTVNESPGAPSAEQAAGNVQVNGAGPVSLNTAELARIGVTGSVSMADSRKHALQGVFLGRPATNENNFCPVNPDGTFRCEAAIAPGRYQVRLASNDLYIQSLTAKGAVYASGLLDLHEGELASLTIVAAPGITNLNGIALRAGRPVSGAMILLLPRSLELGAGIPRDQSDSDGTFTLQAVHPGLYFLVAIDNGHDLEYHNLNAIQPYLSGARPVEVPLANDAPIEVNVQPRQ